MLYYNYLNTDLSPSLEIVKQFPHLKTEGLSEEKKQRLLGRLKVESGVMQDKFAILVDRARESLVKKNVSSGDLKILVKCSQASTLHSIFTEVNSINTLFEKLCDYWSFFDYELVSLIIKRHCKELLSDLDVYKSELKKYCCRRIIEVPTDIFASMNADKNSLFVKCDITFDTMTLEQVKDLESRLSVLLDSDLYLLQIKEGCTLFIFNSLCPISTLTSAQKEELANMQVVILYCDSVYYQSPGSGSTSSSIGNIPQGTQYNM